MPPFAKSLCYRIREYIMENFVRSSFDNSRAAAFWNTRSRRQRPKIGI